MKTLSIALCTYNGGKFLREQLQSLANQTLLPFEIVITDDCSTDNTEQIVEEFKDVLRIRFYKNPSPLRVNKNFEKAISLCKGDIIVPCDQDDIWHPEKLSTICRYFKNNPTQLTVFSDAILIDESGNSLGKTFWSVVRFHALQIQQWKNGYAFDLLLHGNRTAGCMMAFRKELLEYTLPFPTHIPEMIHDGWLTIMSAMFNRLGMIEETLISYRQHQFQQIGTRPKEGGKVLSLKERFSRSRAEKIAPFVVKRDYFCTLKEAISEHLKNVNDEAVKQNFAKISKIIKFYETRASLPAFRLARIFPVLVMLFKGMYHTYKDQEADLKAPYLAAIGDILE
ncbi:glycosyltransferase family 2 protein [Arcicella rigui]|uniref:Glycosyltransferase family 2 protein n=1 Tax=Arcicella rigui TaxID=797020 RepID=A0ABU5Q9K2_9BACT|nr:glycosyltransferase family 2 protein [Arcicella rigui]MEA5139322.1 glycosyltransferase family 2 protein [Arcicella rigui]